MTRNHYLIIKMGGTIEFKDPAYGEINDKLLKLDTTIESYLTNIVKPHFLYTVVTVAEKDSRDLDEHDREKLLQSILGSDTDKVVVTHGTFTMKQTAEYLQNAGLGTKKVILTGSMIPVAGFAASDAGFNLGFAIGSFETLEPGVYLSMNGGIFRPEEVDKNIEEFRFE